MGLVHLEHLVVRNAVAFVVKGTRLSGGMVSVTGIVAESDGRNVFFGFLNEDRGRLGLFLNVFNSETASNSSAFLRSRDLGHQSRIDSHAVVRVREHGCVSRQSRVSFVQQTLALSLVFIPADKCLLSIEAFLDKLQGSAGFIEIAGHSVGLLKSGSHVMVGQRMVQLRVIDEVDSAGLVADFVHILPSSLSFKHVGESVFQIHGLGGQFTSTAKEPRVEVEDGLSVLLVADDL